jgi:pimeloyl-ACP methyl ester carboxylesterase
MDAVRRLLGFPFGNLRNGVIILSTLTALLVLYPVPTALTLAYMLLNITTRLLLKQPIKFGEHKMAYQCHSKHTATDNQPAKPCMIFLHGWPDNAESFSAQISSFTDTNNVYSLELPHYASPTCQILKDVTCQSMSCPADTTYSTIGYNFDDLATMAASSIAEIVASHKQKGCIFVVHDWGAYTGIQVQRRYPHLSDKLVGLDVGWCENRAVPFSTSLVLTIVMGLAYQWWAIWAWLLAVTVPIVGEPVGTIMLRLQMYSTIGSGLPKTSLQTRKTPLTAYMNYPYFYFHLQLISEGLGLRASFDDRHNITAPRVHDPESDARVLFIYSQDKGFKFHPPALEKIEKRENCQCSAVGEAGKSSGPKLGHWFHVNGATETNELIRGWLSTTSNKSKDKI